MNQEELNIILNSYDWIKVYRYKLLLENWRKHQSWIDEYEILLGHHENETAFLINKVRELAQQVYDLEQRNKELLGWLEDTVIC